MVRTISKCIYFNENPPVLTGTLNSESLQIKLILFSSLKEIACENEQLNLKCPLNKVLSIQRAIYGRTNTQSCCMLYHLRDVIFELYYTKHPLITEPHSICVQTKCVSNEISFVMEKCDSKNECSFNVNNVNLVDKCIGTYKYMEVDYECI